MRYEIEYDDEKRKMKNLPREVMEKKRITVFDESKFKHAFLEQSKFSVMFSKQKSDYIKSVEPYIHKACEIKKIEFNVDHQNSVMSVATTDRTRDPYVIIKANDLIQLLSKGVPLEQAVLVLEDDIFGEVIPVKMLCSNEKTFERRKNRLDNPKILKAVELLTKCKLFISGKVVSIIGNYRGLNEAKAIVIACFENTHPAYEIKKSIIKHKLEKEGKEGEWDRYLPTIKKTHSKKITKKRISGGMPADIPQRKEDIARITGEYYANPRNVARDSAAETRRLKREKIRQTRREAGSAEED